MTHALALKTACQSLLATLAPSVGWSLITEQALANGQRPDGALRDGCNLSRGY
jgi:hypothetical protein